MGECEGEMRACHARAGSGSRPRRAQGWCMVPSVSLCFEGKHGAPDTRNRKHGRGKEERQRPWWMVKIGMGLGQSKCLVGCEAEAEAEGEVR